MANHLWKVITKKSIAKLVKGMEVEILKSGTTAKPNQKEIAAALEKNTILKFITAIVVHRVLILKRLNKNSPNRYIREFLAHSLKNKVII